MAKSTMSDLVKKRMSATQQASELVASDEAYKAIFQGTPKTERAEIKDLPIDSLVPFFTADIGFKPYREAKLKAFSEQIKEEGILERIIVRPISSGDKYEILAGHNRTAAAKLAGLETVPVEIVKADDARAVVIATATNLLRRQELSIFERGKAYKALLEAKRNQGCRSDLTSGEIRQKFLTRQIVADFFGVTEHEVRKAIKLTQLIPEIQEIIESDPKRVNLACADMIADYDTASQQTFLLMCQRTDVKLDMATMKYIVRKCPPPSAERSSLVEAWNDVQRNREKRLLAPPKKITFNRKRFEPYLSKLGNEKELEELFLEFLRERILLSSVE